MFKFPAKKPILTGFSARAPAFASNFEGSPEGNSA